MCGKQEETGMRMFNTDKNTTTKRIFAAIAVSLLLVMLAGCTSPLDTIELGPPGSLTLNFVLPPIGEVPLASRAIMPGGGWPSENPARIDLLFVHAIGRGETETRQLTGMRGTVEVPSGTWNVNATAFFNVGGELVPMARGYLAGVTVSENAANTVSTPVRLLPLIDSRYTGTFRWIITFPATVQTARMELIPWGVGWTGGTQAAHVFYLEGTPTAGASAAARFDTRTLPAGEYLLTLTLTTADGRQAIRSEILRIYGNMEITASRSFVTEDLTQ
jgi:hypothetical protein